MPGVAMRLDVRWADGHRMIRQATELRKTCNHLALYWDLQLEKISPRCIGFREAGCVSLVDHASVHPKCGGLERRPGVSSTDTVDPVRRGVAVDLDGVLLDGMQFHIRAWNSSFAGYDVQLTARDFYLLEGIKSRDIVDRICEMYQLDLAPAERDVIAKLKKETYEAIFEPIALDGGAELLDACRDSDYWIAIVTGTYATSVTQALDLFGKREFVDHVISADLSIPGKPDPAPFREAVARLGVATRNCLAIDNAPAGVRSAKDAGLPCAGVATYLTETDLLVADVLFENVSALADWIRVERGGSGGQGQWAI